MAGANGARSWAWIVALVMLFSGLSSPVVAQETEEKQQAEERTEAQKKLERLEQELQAIKASLEEGRSEEERIEQLRLEDGTSISVYDEVSVKVVDQPALLKWIRRHKLASLLTMHSSRLGTLTKDRLLAQQEAPDGVDVGTFKRTKKLKG